MIGKHLLMDILTDNPISTIDDIKPMMEEIIKIGNLNVLDKTQFQFNPIGATMIYLLSESHLSIHTYPEDKYVALDLYCCNPDIDMTKIIDYIKIYLNIKDGRGQSKEIERILR